MTWLLSLLLIYVHAAPYSTTVCGLYQVEDFGDRITYSVTRFESRWQSLFTVTNPGDPTVKNMMPGMCYCVEGLVQQDPEFDGDENFQLVTVSRIQSPGYFGCVLGPSPP